MWNVSAVVLPNGAKSLYEYNSDNNMSKVTDALGNIIEFQYDANGHCIVESDCMGRKEFTYDAVGRLIQVKNSDGGITKYEYDSEDHIIHIVDPMNNEVYMEYDQVGNLIEERNNIGQVRKYTYTKMRNLDTITDEGGLVTKYSYLPGEERISEILYPDGNSKKYEYDLNGNIIAFIDVIGNRHCFTYDSLNRIDSIIRADGYKENYKYDEVGNVISITDHNGNSSYYSYSERNELLKVQDALGNVVEYEYDSNGELVKIIQKGNNNDSEDIVTSYNRDILGRVVGIKDSLGCEESYKYNGNGYLTEKIDKEGYLTKYGYTNRGDVNNIKFADGKEVQFSYNVLRHLEEIKDWTGTTSIKNDELGRALNISYPDGKEISYTYSTSGERTSLTYPNGKTIKYNYDKLNRLVSMEDDDNITTYEYDEYSHLRSKLMPNGVKTEYSYDNRGLLTSLKNNDAEGIIDHYLYKYDTEGNKTEIIKKRRNMPEENGHYTYSYDALKKLTSVYKDGDLLHSYDYDAFGNRISMTTQEGTTYYKYNSLNQLISKTDSTGEENYTYDARGNMCQIDYNGKIMTKFNYGTMNRLTRVENVDGLYAEYEYSGLGHRIGAREYRGQGDPEVNINYVLDITKQYNNLLQKVESGKTQTYLFDSKATGMIDNDGIYSYFVHDDLGSPIRLLGQNGNIIESYGYDEFGCDLEYGPSKIHSFGYTGYQRDRVSGIYYAQAREYIPYVARFGARDFVKGQQDDPLSMNEYVYCRDNPTEYVDLNGLFAIVAAIAIGAVVGGAISGGINAASQLKDMKKDKDKEFNWWKVGGAFVNGAIVGGVTANPATGLLGTVVAGAAGSGAESLISQTFTEDKKVDYALLAEDVIVGGATAGIFYGASKFINKGIGVVKKELGIVKNTVNKKLEKGTFELIEESTKEINKWKARIASIKASGHTPTNHRMEHLKKAKEEAAKWLKKYAVECFKVGFKGGTKTGFYNILGIKSTETVVEDLLRNFCPVYIDEKEDQSFVEYMKDYFRKVDSKLSGKCPLFE